MTDLMPSICGRCKHVHADRQCRRKMLLETRPSPEGAVYVYARICDWCAQERPDLVVKDV